MGDVVYRGRGAGEPDQKKPAEGERYLTKERNTTRRRVKEDVD